MTATCNVENASYVNEIVVFHKLPSHNPDQLPLIPGMAGQPDPVFKVKFVIGEDTGRDFEGQPHAGFDDAAVKFKGADDHFPWEELGLAGDRKHGIEPCDYGGEMEADRESCRDIGRKLLASGYKIVYHKRHAVFA